MRRHRKRRLSKFMLWAALVLLIAGFLARRTLAPRVLHCMTHRPMRAPSPPSAPGLAESQPVPAPGGPPAAGASQDRPPSEKPQSARVSGPREGASPVPSREDLSDADRRGLDEVLRRKLK